MEQTALYKLISQAKAENKAVQLLSSHNLDDLKFIIEPWHKVVNEPDNIIKCDDCLIDLKLIVAALIVPNREDRQKEMERIEEEIKDLHKLNPKSGRLSYGI